MDLKEQAGLNVPTPMISINTPPQSTDTIGMTAQCTKQTSEQLTLPQFQTQTYSLADFLARVSVLLESGEDLKTQEALCSLKSLESLGLNDLSIYGLRTSRDSSAMMRAIPLRQSFQPLMNWGMTVNGVCLTARISESHRIGKECSLSDILEDNPDQKYFLSENMYVSVPAGQ